MMRTGVRTAPALFFSLLAISPLVSAAVWDIEPKVVLTTGYNDNVGLKSADEEGSPEGRLVASTKFKVNTPKSGTSGNITVDLRRHSQQTTFDRNNIRAGISSFYNLENSALGLNGNFVRDSTLDSQLDDTGTGFVDLNRNDRLAGAFWRYNFSSRTNASVNYNYRDVAYEKTANSGFVDFSSHSGSLRVNHRMSPQTTVFGSGSYSQNENSNDVTTVNASFSGGGSYNIDTTLSASISLGRRKTTVDYRQNRTIPIVIDNGPAVFIVVPEDITIEGKGTTYDIAVTKTFERGRTTLSANQDISTSVNGIPIEVTHLGSVTHYGISTTISTDLALRGTQTESQDLFGNTFTRKNLSIEPKINWKFTESLTISAVYRLRIYSFDNQTDDAVQNAAYLTLIYQ